MMSDKKKSIPDIVDMDFEFDLSSEKIKSHLAIYIDFLEQRFLEENYVKKWNYKDIKNYYENYKNDQSVYNHFQLAILSEIIKLVLKVLSSKLLLSGMFDSILDVFDKQGRRKKQKTVFQPPGAGLGIIAEFVFSKKTFKRVLQPVIADLQEEYIEALAKGKVWKTRWVWFRGYCAFWSAFFAQLPVSVLRAIVKMWTTAG